MDYTEIPYKFKLQEKYLKPGYYHCPPNWCCTMHVDDQQKLTTQTLGNTLDGCPMCGADYVFTCYCGMLEVLSNS